MQQTRASLHSIYCRLESVEGSIHGTGGGALGAQASLAVQELSEKIDGVQVHLATLLLRVDMLEAQVPLAARSLIQQQQQQ